LKKSIEKEQGANSCGSIRPEIFDKTWRTDYSQSEQPARVRSTIKDLRNVLELGHDSADEKFLDALQETKDAIGGGTTGTAVSLANDSLHHSPVVAAEPMKIPLITNSNLRLRSQQIAQNLFRCEEKRTSPERGQRRSDAGESCVRLLA